MPSGWACPWGQAGGTALPWGTCPWEGQGVRLRTFRESGQQPHSCNWTPAIFLTDTVREPRRQMSEQHRRVPVGSSYRWKHGGPLEGGCFQVPGSCSWPSCSDPAARWSLLRAPFPDMLPQFLLPAAFPLLRHPTPLGGLPCSHSLGPAPPSHPISPEVFVQFLDEVSAPWRGKGLSGACPAASVLPAWAPWGLHEHS